MNTPKHEAPAQDLPAAAFGLFDFSLLTGAVILVDQQAYAGTFAPLLAYPILAIILLVKRRSIEPSDRNGAVASGV